MGLRMQDLLVEIEQFCQRNDVSETRFGELAMNDKPFVSQLRAGRDLRGPRRRGSPDTACHLQKLPVRPGVFPCQLQLRQSLRTTRSLQKVLARLRRCLPA